MYFCPNKKSSGYIGLILTVFFSVIILFAFVVGSAYFFYRTSDGDLPDFREEFVSSMEDPVVKEEIEEQNSPEFCDITYADPILPSQNETQESTFESSFNNYSGKINRKLIDNTIYIDVSLRGLDEGKKYVLHAVDVDDNNNVCYSSVMGEINYIASTRLFVSGMYKMDSQFVNDATIFVITKDGFGLTGQELTTLDNPSIIMRATFLP